MVCARGDIGFCIIIIIVGVARGRADNCGKKGKTQGVEWTGYPMNEKPRTPRSLAARRGMGQMSQQSPVVTSRILYRSSVNTVRAVLPFNERWR